MTHRFHLQGMLAAVIISTIAWSTPTSALLVQPVFLDMRYVGTRSSAGIRVVNDRITPMSVEVEVSRITIPEEGPVIYEPVDGDDFLIYPAVATVQPNATQIFRVRWVGDAPEQGQMFALTTSELPTSAAETEATAAVQLLYAIQTIVAIGPDRAEPDVSIVQSERFTNADGVAGVRVLFENSGRLHAQVNTSSIDLVSGDWRQQISADTMRNVSGLGLVPSGGRRWMFIPAEGMPTDGPVQATLSYSAAR